MRQWIWSALLPMTLVVGWFAQPAWAGGGCHDDISDTTGTKVVLAALCFSPTVTRVAPGQTVTWFNKDETPHTVTAAGFAFSQELNTAGDSFSHRFQDEGVFPYVCLFHPGMVGAVVVGDGVASGTAGVAPAPAQPKPPASTEGVRLAGGVSSGWRTVAIVALGLALVAVTMVVTLLARRRPARSVVPG